MTLKFKKIYSIATVLVLTTSDAQPSSKQVLIVTVEPSSVILTCPNVASVEFASFAL